MVIINNPIIIITKQLSHILLLINCQYYLTECLANFLSGEGRLESFLEQTPPIDVNISKAKSGLIEAKQNLLLAANEREKQVKKRLISSHK